MSRNPICRLWFGRLIARHDHALISRNVQEVFHSDDVVAAFSARMGVEVRECLTQFSTGFVPFA